MILGLAPKEQEAEEVLALREFFASISPSERVRLYQCFKEQAVNLPPLESQDPKTDEGPRKGPAAKPVEDYSYDIKRQTFLGLSDAATIGGWGS